MEVFLGQQPGQVEGQVGCIRRVMFDNGLHAVVEQLVALDDADHIMYVSNFCDCCTLRDSLGMGTCCLQQADGR